MKSKPEQKVVDGCKARLRYWKEVEKVVIDYYDLSNLGRKYIRGQWITNNEEGRPDIVSYIRHNRMLWLYIIECKEPGGGVWSEKQQEYARRFSCITNAKYHLVTNPNMVDDYIESITKHSETKLNSIEL